MAGCFGKLFKRRGKSLVKNNQSDLINKTFLFE